MWSCNTMLFPSLSKRRKHHVGRIRRDTAKRCSIWKEPIQRWICNWQRNRKVRRRKTYSLCWYKHAWIIQEHRGHDNIHRERKGHTPDRTNILWREVLAKSILQDERARMEWWRRNNWWLLLKRRSGRNVAPFIYTMPFTSTATYEVSACGNFSHPI